MANGIADGTAAFEIFTIQTAAGHLEEHSDDDAREALCIGRGGEVEFAKMLGQHAILHKSDHATGLSRSTRESFAPIGPQIHGRQ